MKLFSLTAYNLAASVRRWVLVSALAALVFSAAPTALALAMHLIDADSTHAAPPAAQPEPLPTANPFERAVALLHAEERALQFGGAPVRVPPTITPTATPTPSFTPTPSVTPTPTMRPTATATPRPSFIWPASGVISQPMWTGHPFGIDIALNTGTPIEAVRDGVVIFAGGDPCCSYGYYIVVEHDDGWTSLYAHQSAFAVLHISFSTFRSLYFKEVLTTVMDLTDRKLLNVIQSQFPLVDRPYQELGNQLGIEESEVIDRLTDLKRKNVLR